jgi:hypothetical protein
MAEVENYPYDVYVSYSNRDEAWVRSALLPQLKRAGYRVFSLLEAVLPGEDWQKKALEALAQSKNLLCVVSPGYGTEWNNTELNGFSGKSFLPVVIEKPDNLPEILRPYSALTFTNSSDSWDRLFSALGRPGTYQGRPAAKAMEVSDSRAPAVNESASSTVKASGSPSGPQTEPGESYSVNGRGISDGYSQNDLLGYVDYVEALANFIESPMTQKPITIGIDAVWGGGKTTLMHMLEKRLGLHTGKNAGRIYTVWFNAWQYDQQETLWGALVLDILAQVRKQYGFWGQLPLFLRLNRGRFDLRILFLDLGKVLLRVLGLAAALFSVLAFFSIYFNKGYAETLYWLWTDQIKALLTTLGSLSLLYTLFVDAWKLVISPFSLGLSKYIKEPDYSSKIGFVRQFQQDFKTVISAVTQKGKWPLVVFIDDLDRCSPAKAAEVIEAVNLLLDSEYCVFILGMDSAMLSRSIQAHYKEIQPYFDDLNYASRTGLGRHFLEKIIQIDFRIPPPDPEHISSFILAQLGQNQPAAGPLKPVAEKQAESLLQAEQRAGKSLGEARKLVAQNYPDLAADLENAQKAVQARSFEEIGEVQEAIQEMAAFLDYNPRRIKRFINLYRLQALIAQQRHLLETTLSFDTLARWVLIQMRWPDFILDALQEPALMLQLCEDLRLLEQEPSLEKHRAIIDGLKNSGKYPAATCLLLSSPDYQKLMLSLAEKAGEAQNYLNLAQWFGAPSQRMAE